LRVEHLESSDSIHHAFQLLQKGETLEGIQLNLLAFVQQN